MGNYVLTPQGMNKTMVHFSGPTMGTKYDVKIVTPQIPQLQVRAVANETMEILDDLNKQMNHYDPNSEISQFNRLSANKPFAISDDFLKVVQFSQRIHKDTRGAFDISLGNLINLWGFGIEDKDDSKIPTDTEIDNALSRSGHHLFELSPDGRLKKNHKHVKLNLSAVAKGYAIDKIAAFLKKEGFGDFMIDIGGEIAVAGTNAVGKPWTVGIIHDTDKRLSVSNKAIASSGNYETYWEHAGERYGHIIDPKTGHPTTSSILGVTVIAPTCMLADAAATAMMVMSTEESQAWIEKIPDTEAMIVIQTQSGELTEIMSSGFNAYLD